MSHSGRFVLRIAPSIHARLKKLATDKGVSLNRICDELIQRGLESQLDKNLPDDRLSAIKSKLLKKFGDHLLGMVVFGSVLQNKMFETSDIDLLIVLSNKQMIDRVHYKWWDDCVEDMKTPIINPHFTSLPSEQDLFGSLWLEVANQSHLYWQANPRLSKKLGQIKDMILQGRVRRETTYGQPYWIWENSHAQS